MAASVGGVGLSQTIFTQDSLATGIISAGFDTISANALTLRSATDPSGLVGLLGSSVNVPGVSADLPANLAQPTQISAANIVALAQQQTGLDLGGFFETSPFSPLLQGVFDRPPPLENFAREVIEASLIAAVERAVEEQSEEALAEISGPETTFNAAFQRPSEAIAFPTFDFSGAAFDSEANSIFFNRVGVPSGGSITLSDILQFASTGDADGFAVSLIGEDGGTPGGTLTGPDGAGTELFIPIDELANTTYTPPSTGIGQDYISIIEVTGEGTAGEPFTDRGVLQTVSVTYAGESQSRQSGDERITDFFFGAESRSGQTQVRLNITGLSSGTLTTAADLINAGLLRVRGQENRADGTINSAVTNLYESAGANIILRFPFQTTTNGVTGSIMKFELRSLDLNFSLSGARVFAIFG